MQQLYSYVAVISECMLLPQPDSHTQLLLPIVLQT